MAEVSRNYFYNREQYRPYLAGFLTNQPLHRPIDTVLDYLETAPALVSASINSLSETTFLLFKAMITSEHGSNDAPSPPHL